MNQALATTSCIHGQPTLHPPSEPVTPPRSRSSGNSSGELTFEAITTRIRAKLSETKTDDDATYSTRRKTHSPSSFCYSNWEAPAARSVPISFDIHRSLVGWSARCVTLGRVSVGKSCHMPCLQASHCPSMACFRHPWFSLSIQLMLAVVIESHLPMKPSISL